MGRFFAQLQAIWSRMETPQRASLVLVAVAFTGLILFIGYGATRSDLRVLATDLSRAQVAEIASFLRGQGVDYEVADGERTILVPAKEVYTLRNELAEQDLLDGDSAGFKLLDNAGFGQSNHMEMRLYDRAVAGELEKSFTEISGVRSARVIISRPQPSPFLRETDEPSISVKLNMSAGRRLSERQLAGVTHLAAAAVEGASPSRVQVMDSQGLISRNDEDADAMRVADEDGARRAREKDLEAKAQRQLDRILGPGKSAVSISLDLDFTKRATARTRLFDPVVLESSTTSRSSSTPIPRSGGVAGTAPNVEGDNGLGGGGGVATETIDEEVLKSGAGKENTTIEEQVGRIRGMTVSVIIDQKRVSADILDAEGNPTGESELRIEDYSDTEKTLYQDTVLDAIGFDAARGAQLALEPNGNVADRFSVTLASVPMYQPEPEADELVQAGVMGMNPDDLERYGGWVIAAIVALGLLFVARGQLKRSHAAWETEQKRRREEEERRKAEEEAAYRAAHPEIEEAEATEEQQRRIALRDQVREQVDNDPEVAAQILKAWIHE